MKLDPKLKELITKAAASYDLNPAIIYGIVCVESAGKPGAKRKEPEFFIKYVSDAQKRIDPQEAENQATSWGLMQVMGLNLRTMGYSGDFNDLLHDSTMSMSTALDFGCMWYKKIQKKYYDKWGRKGVIAAYNAGSPRTKKSGEFVNQNYVDKVLKESRDY